MASFQISATPAEDLITETEATSNEQQVVAPPPLEPVKTVDVEDDEEDFEGLITAPPYEHQIENSNSDDEEEEKDTAEYSPFIDGDEEELFRPAAGEPAAAFCDFNEDDDEDEA